MLVCLLVSHFFTPLVLWGELLFKDILNLICVSCKVVYNFYYMRYMSVIGNILFQSLSHDLSVCVCVTCETERRVRRQSPGQSRLLPSNLPFYSEEPLQELKLLPLNSPSRDCPPPPIWPDFHNVVRQCSYIILLFHSLRLLPLK